jgi:hypothetical protein
MGAGGRVGVSEERYSTAAEDARGSAAAGALARVLPPPPAAGEEVDEGHGRGGARGVFANDTLTGACMCVCVRVCVCARVCGVC